MLDIIDFDIDEIASTLNCKTLTIKLESASFIWLDELIGIFPDGRYKGLKTIPYKLVHYNYRQFLASKGEVKVERAHKILQDKLFKNLGSNITLLEYQIFQSYDSGFVNIEYTFARTPDFYDHITYVCKSQDYALETFNKESPIKIEFDFEDLRPDRGTISYQNHPLHVIKNINDYLFKDKFLIMITEDYKDKIVEFKVDDLPYIDIITKESNQEFSRSRLGLLADIVTKRYIQIKKSLENKYKAGFSMPSSILFKNTEKLFYKSKELRIDIAGDLSKDLSDDSIDDGVFPAKSDSPQRYFNRLFRIAKELTSTFKFQNIPVYSKKQQNIDSDFSKIVTEIVLFKTDLEKNLMPLSLNIDANNIEINRVLEIESN